MLAIFFPMPVKNLLNSSAIEAGFSKVLLPTVIFVMLLWVGFPVVSSLSVSYVFFGFLMFALSVDS